MNRPVLRWLAPVAAAVVFVGGGAAVSALGSTAHADLPARSAATLLTDVAHAHLQGLSGTVLQSTDLGLPALPASLAGEGSSADFSSLISGTHTMRVWYAAPGRSRVALLGDGSESDLVSDGQSVWLWSSADHAVTRWQLPVPAAATTPPAALAAVTPQQLADRALAAIRPTTRVTTNGSATVAGRPAYLLTISPRTDNTLVDSVQIAIDSATHVPTRVQVFARHHTSPALSVGYTSFHPTMPDAARFRFTPPPGAKVTEKTLPSRAGEHAGHAPSTDHAGPSPTVVGSGWSTVAVLPAAAGKELVSGGGQLTGLLRQLTPVSGDWGSGRLLSGTLLSAVIADDGRVAIGAVPPATLYAALQHAAGQR